MRLINQEAIHSEQFLCVLEHLKNVILNEKITLFNLYSLWVR